MAIIGSTRAARDAGHRLAPMPTARITALGATSGDVMHLIVRGGLALAIAGVAIGLGLALAAVGFIGPLLFNTSPRDPVVLGGVAFGLLLAAAFACRVPAARAARVNPMEAMRVE